MTQMEITAQDLAIRGQYPLLAAHPGLAYLDSAATSQRPACVLESVRRFYEQDNANPLRGLYSLSQRATEAYEDARETVRAFLNAKSTEEIVFTRNASESLNLLAYSLSDGFLNEGDEILVTVMEHHSNMLPWQQAARRAGAILRFLEPDSTGFIPEEAFLAALGERTKLVAMTQVSNALGTENDIQRFAALAHSRGALFVCDGAQSVPHMPVDVQALDVDFLAFSGHKMGGPMGIGVLYGKKEHFLNMPPFLYGGEMIEYVTREDATWAELPHKFEAGTVNAAGAVGLAEAIRFYQKIGWETIRSREERLGQVCFDILSGAPHIRLLGAADAAAHHGIFTFTVEGVHPHDIAQILDDDGICIRAGHHCAQPLMQFLGTPSTARVSLAFYNTEEELRRFGDSLLHIRERMGYGQ